MKLQSAKKHLMNKAETEARNEQIRVQRANELILVEQKIREVKQEQLKLLETKTNTIKKEREICKLTKIEQERQFLERIQGQYQQKV